MRTQNVVDKPLEEKPRIDQFLLRILRVHQLEAVNFFWRIMTGQELKMKSHGGYGAILADEMGLGKTLTTISLIWCLLRQYPPV